jgi:hypothetical protein
MIVKPRGAVDGWSLVHAGQAESFVGRAARGARAVSAVFETSSAGQA